MKSCLECLRFESSICVFCESPKHNFYEPPITLVETKEQHDACLNDIPF